MSQPGIRSPAYNQQNLKRGNVLIRFILDHPDSHDHVTRKSVESVGERKSESSVSYHHRRLSALSRSQGYCGTSPITTMTSSSPYLDSSSPSVSMSTSGDRKKSRNDDGGDRWRGTSERLDPTSGSYDVTDGDGCLVSCFPNCRKPIYRGGQTMTGIVLIKPVYKVTISGVFVKMWGIESTKWRSRERVYSGERVFFKKMVVIVKNRLTNLNTKWYKYDFEYQLPTDLLPSFKMADGSRKYRACAVISQPYGSDLEGHPVGFSLVANSSIGLLPYDLRDDYEIRFSTNQPTTHVKCSCQNKSKTPPTSSSSSSFPSSPPITSSSKSALHQRSLSKPSSSSSSSPWLSFTSIKSAWMKSCCCCCRVTDQSIKSRSNGTDQSGDSIDDLHIDPCGHVGLLLKFNSDINYNDEVSPFELQINEDIDKNQSIRGSLRINGRVFAPLDTVHVTCTIENGQSTDNLLCCLKLKMVVKFTTREATLMNSRNNRSKPRQFKIEPRFKMVEEDLLKTEQVFVAAGEMKCFGIRFNVPNTIISNISSNFCDNHSHELSSESFVFDTNTDTTEEDLVTFTYFCLMEIRPVPCKQTGIIIPIKVHIADRPNI